MIRARHAGAAVIVGGLTLFADLALRLLSGLSPTYFVVAAVMACCLAAGPWGLWVGGALGLRSHRTAAVGTAIVTIGAALWIAAFALLLVDAEVAFTQRLTPAGSLLMAVGMVVLGVGVVRSRRLAGWRRFVPLAVGLYFPLQLVVQLAFFLDGRDDQLGPNGWFLGAWGLLWALLGTVLISDGGRMAGSSAGHSASAGPMRWSAR